MREALLLALLNIIIVLSIVLIATRVVLFAIKNKKVKKLKKYTMDPK